MGYLLCAIYKIFKKVYFLGGADPQVAHEECCMTNALGRLTWGWGHTRGKQGQGGGPAEAVFPPGVLTYPNHPGHLGKYTSTTAQINSAVHLKIMLEHFMLCVFCHN